MVCSTCLQIRAAMKENTQNVAKIVFSRLQFPKKTIKHDVRGADAIFRRRYFDWRKPTR